MNASASPSETASNNGIRPKLEELNGEVLTAIQRQVLTPAVVRAAARLAVDEIRKRANANPNTADQLRRELGKAEKNEIASWSLFRIGGKKLEPLVAALAQGDQRADTLRRELAQLDSPALLDQLSDKRLERQLTERAAHWREVLAGDVPPARQALRALMAGPISKRTGFCACVDHARPRRALPVLLPFARPID